MDAAFGGSNDGLVFVENHALAEQPGFLASLHHNGAVNVHIDAPDWSDQKVNEK